LVVAAGMLYADPPVNEILAAIVSPAANEIIPD
jgi:hypothetical protein